LLKIFKKELKTLVGSGTFTFDERKEGESSTLIMESSSKGKEQDCLINRLMIHGAVYRMKHP